MLASQFLERGWRIAFPKPMVLATTAETLKFSVRSPRKVLTQKVQSKRHWGRLIPITKRYWSSVMSLLGLLSQNRLRHSEDGGARLAIRRDGCQDVDIARGLPSHTTGLLLFQSDPKLGH
jgi:hypothetical protein